MRRSDETMPGREGRGILRNLPDNAKIRGSDQPEDRTEEYLFVMEIKA